MANTISIVFKPCMPAPSGGYIIKYRPRGSGEAYRTWPVSFTSSPAVFSDPSDPDGTEFEGFILGDCGDGQGVPVPWDTGEGSAGGGSDASEGAGGCIGGLGTVIVNNQMLGVTVTAVNGIPGFTAVPPSMLPGSSRSGSHTAFSGAVSFTVSGSNVTGSANLFQNNTLVGCITLDAAGAYAFPAVDWEACDTIFLFFYSGNCLVP